MARQRAPTANFVPGPPSPIRATLSAVTPIGFALLLAVPPAAGSCGGAEAAALRQQGVELVEAKKYTAAIDVLARSIPAGCDDSELLFRRVDAYMGMPMADPYSERLYELIHADLLRMRELDPSDLFARKHLADDFRRMGRHLEAAQEWRTVLHHKKKLHPLEDPRMQPDTWADCATEFLEAGDAAAAHAMLKEYFASYERKAVADRRVEDTAPHCAMAEVLLKMGRAKEALVYARKAVRSKHVNGRDHRTHVRVLEALARPGDALAAAKALARWEGDPSADTEEIIARLQNAQGGSRAARDR
jgi:tetratricopeptide (TPR) repeat protein